MTCLRCEHGVYHQKPGSLSPRGVLDVGLRCPHSCRFCYYSFWDNAAEQFQALRQATFRPGDQCRAILDGLTDQGLEFYDITGGEPRIHPEIVQTVAHGAALGLKSRLITLGQFPARDAGPLDALLDAGLTDVLFSMHAVNETDFAHFTKGSWRRLSAALDRLDARDFAYGANTVIFEGNCHSLTDIARESARRRVYVHNFIVFNAYHAWNTAHRVAGVQASFHDIAPELTRAVSILDAAGVAVNIRYVPLCVFPGLARHIVGVLGVPYDPFEWRNRACNPDRDPAYCADILPIPPSGIRDIYALHSCQETLTNGLEILAMRGDHFKLFPAVCRDCAAIDACDGVAPSYLERHGAEELRPLATAELAGPLLRERLAYNAAHRVKAEPFAPMR